MNSKSCSAARSRTGSAGWPFNKLLDGCTIASVSAPARKNRHGLKRPAYLPYVLLAVSVLFWAGNWVFARALRFDVPPVALAFWRWLVALVILTPFAYAHVRRQWRMIAGAWRVLA